LKKEECRSLSSTRAKQGVSKEKRKITSPGRERLEPDRGSKKKRKGGTSHGFVKGKKNLILAARRGEAG